MLRDTILLSRVFTDPAKIRLTGGFLFTKYSVDCGPGGFVFKTPLPVNKNPLRFAEDLWKLHDERGRRVEWGGSPWTGKSERVRVGARPPWRATRPRS